MAKVKNTVFGKGILAIVAAFLVLSAASAAMAATYDLTGEWNCNDQGRYYIRQVGNEVFWYGEANGGGWSNVGHGTIQDNLVIIRWTDVPKGGAANTGILVLEVGGSHYLRRIDTSGAFGGSEWFKI